MNKSEFITTVSEAANVSKKDAEAVMNAVFATLSSEMQKGESVRIGGFGTFTVRKRAAKTARNPRTGEMISLPESTVPAFKPCKELKAQVNN